MVYDHPWRVTSLSNEEHAARRVFKNEKVVDIDKSKFDLTPSLVTVNFSTNSCAIRHVFRYSQIYL